jgi:hypothetical protein
MEQSENRKARGPQELLNKNRASQSSAEPLAKAEAQPARSLAAQAAMGLSIVDLLRSNPAPHPLLSTPSQQFEGA